MTTIERDTALTRNGTLRYDPRRETVHASCAGYGCKGCSWHGFKCRVCGAHFSDDTYRCRGCGR